MRKSTVTTRGSHKAYLPALVWAFFVGLIGLIGLPDAFAQSDTVARAGIFSKEAVWQVGSNFYVRVTCSHPYPHLRIFIDTDNNAETGYIVNGIGADYVIEDGMLHHYLLPGGIVWSWGKPIPIIEQARPAPDTFEFGGSIASIGSPPVASIVFQRADDNQNTLTDPNTVRFVQGASSGNGGGSSGGGVNPMPSTVVAGSGFSNEQASDDGVNFYFRAVSAVVYPHYQVLIDTKNYTAGFADKGIAADYMIQDDKLYYYSKAADGRWVWGQGIPNVVRSTPAPNTVEFAVPLSAIGSPSTAKVIFQAIDANGSTVSDPILTPFVRGSPSQIAGDYRPGPVDDSQEGWIFSGMVEVDDDGCKGGMEHAGGPSTYAAYTFNGAGVDIYATTGPSIEAGGRTHKLGRMKISIDGKPDGEYSLSQTSVTYQSKVYSVTGLTRGNHVLQLESGGGWIDVDFIQVSNIEQVPAASTP